MLDIKLIREDVDGVIAQLERRGKDFSILREVKKFDEDKRALTVKVDELKNFRNQKSKEIGKKIVLYKEGKDDKKKIILP